jgi:hypothetical protein
MDANWTIALLILLLISGLCFLFMSMVGAYKFHNSIEEILNEDEN